MNKAEPKIRPITTFAEFRGKFLQAIAYSLQFGRIPQAFYPRHNWDGTFNSYYPYARIQEVFDMANKKPSRKNSFQRDIEFINFKFDAATKARFDDWYNTKGNTVLQAIFETLQAENKMSISWDDSSDCFIASMTGKPESLNKGKCITIRSAEWMRALSAVAFIHIVLFDGEIWEVSGETDLV